MFGRPKPTAHSIVVRQIVALSSLVNPIWANGIENELTPWPRSHVISKRAAPRVQDPAGLIFLTRLEFEVGAMPGAWLRKQGQSSGQRRRVIIVVDSIHAERLFHLTHHGVAHVLATLSQMR